MTTATIRLTIELREIEIAGERFLTDDYAAVKTAINSCVFTDTPENMLADVREMLDDDHFGHTTQLLRIADTQEKTIERIERRFGHNCNPEIVRATQLSSVQHPELIATPKTETAAE